jgi:hypothetical protein
VIKDVTIVSVVRGFVVITIQILPNRLFAIALMGNRIQTNATAMVGFPTAFHKFDDKAQCLNSLNL